MDDQTKNAPQKYFTKAPQDDSLAKEIARKERALTAAKTARLRALRLAKEAADKGQSDKPAAQEADAPLSARPKRRPAGKSARVVRMSY